MRIRSCFSVGCATSTTVQWFSSRDPTAKDISRSSPSRRTFHFDGFAGRAFAHPRRNPPGDGRAIQLDKDIVHAQASCLRRAAGRDRDYRRPLRRASHQETRIGALAKFAFQGKAGVGEKLVVWNFIEPGNVTTEEILEVRAGYFFNHRADSSALIVELSLLGKIVETSQHVIQRFVIVGGLANRKIEHVADELAFVVIGDAAVGEIVGVVFIEPGVEARFLDALPFARRTRLELADLLREVGVPFIFRPDSAALERKRAVGARHSLRKPERARILLFRVVHRLEALRTDAFHIPGVKEFVRGDGRNHFDRTAANRGAVRMLHSPAARIRIRSDVEEKCVFLERRPAHQLHFVARDPLQRILERGAVPVPGIDYHPEMRAGIIEFKFLEFADFDRRINQLVVAFRGKRIRRGTGRKFGDRFPVGRNICELDLDIFRATVGNVHQNLSEIHECVVRAQLRIEWAGFIPRYRVFDLDRAINGRRRWDSPGLLVHFVRNDRRCTSR